MPSSSDLATSGNTRQRLVLSAVRLFRADGYQGVGVQALCDAAGVRKGSFYHFFASKEELALEALDHAWSAFRDLVVAPSLGLPLGERVEAIRRACQDQEAAGPICGLFVRLVAGISTEEPLLQHRLGEILAEWADLLGGGKDGWAALADLNGRMLIGLLDPDTEPVHS